MHFLRKTLAGLATFFLPICLLLTVLSASVVFTLHSPAKLESWINKSGAYNQVVDAVLAQSQQSAQKEGDTLPVQDPAIQAAAKTAFSPQVLQSGTENVIDGTYHWLEGKTPQPDFSIDLSGPKKQFATSIGDYLRNRLQSLPVCARGQAPASNDLLAINCLPRGFDINAEVQANVDKLANSKEFLGNPVVTANTLKSDNGQSLFDKLQNVPKVYQRASWSPWLLGALVLVSAATIILAYEQRRRGMKRLARIMLPTGVLVIFIGLAIVQLAHRGEKQIHLSGEGPSKLQPALISFINSVVDSLSHVYIWFGAAYVLIGIGLLLAVKFWLKPTPSTVPATDTTDKKQKNRAQKLKPRQASYDTPPD